MKHNFYIPTKLFFGNFSDEKMMGLLDKYKRILVLSSKSAAIKSGAYEKISNLIKSKSKHLFYEDSLFPNPTISLIESLTEKFKPQKIDLIISIGGGSVIDTGKALSLTLISDQDVSDLIFGNVANTTTIDHMAIPTTAGTGSETSKGAILSDYQKQWKGGLRGDYIFPTYAVVCPEFTYSLSKQLTLQTGFDAFTHALESFFSKASTIFTRRISIEAISNIVPSLLEISRSDQLQISHKSKLAYGSMLAGINLGNSSTCLPHRLQYCIGALSNTSHADGLAAVYPAWLRRIKISSKDDFKVINNLIKNFLENKEFDSSNPFENLIKYSSMDLNLSDLGFEPASCDSLTKLISGNLDLDPCYEDFSTVKEIFQESF